MTNFAKTSVVVVVMIAIDVRGGGVYYTHISDIDSKFIQLKFQQRRRLVAWESSDQKYHYF